MSSAATSTSIVVAATPAAEPDGGAVLRYVGVLELQAEGAAGEPQPIVDAVSVPMLLPTGGATPSNRALAPAAEPAALVRFEGARRPQTWKTHYVCTGIDCGWAGTTRIRHAQRKPNCPFVPSAMRHRVGESVTQLVSEFLARCTEAQRRQGLPPTGERALPISADAVAAEIPEGCGPGQSFELVIDHDRRMVVHVPDEITVDGEARAPRAGDVLSVHLPKQRKQRQSDVLRKERTKQLHEEKRQRMLPSRAWAVDELPPPVELALQGPELEQASPDGLHRLAVAAADARVTNGVTAVVVSGDS